MATDQERLERELPIGCTLSTEDRERREGAMGDLFGAASRVVELPDGYAFHYPGTADWAHRLVDFVVFERRCCRFFTFELQFTPDEGPIRLSIRGPEGVKDMLRVSPMAGPLASIP